MKRFCVVTILFILIVSAFVIPSFADNIYSFDVPVVESLNSDYTFFRQVGDDQGNPLPSSRNWNYYIATNKNNVYCFYNTTDKKIYFVSDDNTAFAYGKRFNGSNSVSALINNSSYYTEFEEYIYIMSAYVGTYSSPFEINQYPTTLDGLNAVVDYINNNNSYAKNENVDEFIANTLISMGVKFNSYTSALPVAQSAWNYLIDEDNWYIGSGARNDKDIKWDIDSAVSYLNAQSNNYMDWYNGYKVSKDVTIALNKFIKDNYVASTLNNGTLAGENVYLNTQYMYASSGGSAPGSSFGSSPSAFSFYPASTLTYFNGQYLHDNNEIDLDEFIYTPADVRKFISYPSSAGLIEPPEDSTGTGVITDGNGDTVYNIDLDFPSLDWLADAIQAVLDFLNRLITTIADFLTQILDAILSLFSDAFESLTTFGQGIIEWLYSVIESLGTLGSNYIPSDLWAIILPFIYLNVGIAILMFVLRSH